MDKYIGRLLDNRYEILEVLGTGGMAVVYKARCHRLNRLVAIKILKDDFLEDEEFRRRFHTESQAVAMLSHPNIVSIYDVSSSITADYIVMELVDGITLKQYMAKKGVLNWKETLHFAIQIGKALEHAHSRGIVHRDIKPHNIMVLKNGAVKVMDFGIARMMSKGNTLTKEALGSVHYISPEQAKGGRVDNRSDIYSLGTVMYEMMSGRPPYDGESPVAVAIQHINGGAVMPSTLNPNIPGGLEQIIMKAMSHEVEDRYPTATQMLTDMDEFRKDPAILFDYNTPPLDEVTKLPKPPLVLQPEPVTTADKVEKRQMPERRTPQRPTAERRREGGETPRRRTGQQQNKRNNAAAIAILSCCLVLVVAIVIFLAVLFGDGGQKADLQQVPKVVGMMYQPDSEYEGFMIKLDEEIYSDEFEAGTIIAQTPLEGEQVADGTIYVTVSLGKAPAAVTMIDLTDWELSQAEKKLNTLKLNLKIVVVEEYHETIAEGSVIRSEPEADAPLAADQEIKLYVSQGPEIKTSAMPNVVGDKLESAKRVLDSQELNLTIEVEEMFDSTVPVGDVIKTEPETGKELKTGQTVTIYVSKGAQLATMPNVTGIDVDKAVNILVSSGFNNYQIELVESDKDKDTVVEQSVAKNTEADVKTEIILYVSKGKNQTTIVTKDVTIDLRGYTNDANCRVTVTKLQNEIVLSGTVIKGKESVVLEEQTGSGIVSYKVVVMDEKGETLIKEWIEEVVF